MIFIWGAVEIYYTCLVCFWKVIVFWGGPYRFTGFCCIWHHHEIFDKKEWNRLFVILKAWNSRRLVHGKEMVWASRWSVALGHIHNVGSGHQAVGLDREDAMNLLVDVAECSWSKDADPLSSNVCGHAQNRLWARQYWRYVPPSFPGPNFQQMVIGRLSVGLSFFSPEISEITGFRWYIHASEFPPTDFFKSSSFRTHACAPSGSRAWAST